MKRALVDASSAILLYKADIFDAVAGVYRLSVVPAVLDEITVPGRSGADRFADYFDAKRVVLSESGGCNAAAAADTGNLDAGERDTILAFEERCADFIIIDDRKGAQYCRDRHLPYINALLCPKLLFLAGVIERQTCRSATDALIQNGRYSRSIISYAEKCSTKALTPFLCSGK